MSKLMPNRVDLIMPFLSYAITNEKYCLERTQSPPSPPLSLRLSFASLLGLASLLALLQPVGFGTSYLRIEALMKRYPTHGLQISALQLVSNAAIAIAWCGLESVSWAGSGAFELSALYEPSVLGGVLYTGLVSTALTVLDACMCPR